MGDLSDVESIQKKGTIMMMIPTHRAP